ncbi:hypothetical protein F0L68_37225 [Solihabitans fulvus]|uniref:Uncharacterized protein n=1 Tax=Solihabitans fulvus TaxID=1892852 RepID=A0A5B2WKK7_9PSEU|nr:hypothetical protein [Solihabitans fulvus]KAA2251454.1 hypothetical protein F0L68_37225 [Solihabitans fulvus]
MYIDEHGGTDGELKVTVDGQEYTAEETYDYDHDGHLDSAVVDTDDGGHVVYTDTHHTGHADLETTYDAHGKPVSAAKFDEHTGKWTAVDPNAAGHDSTSHSGNAIVVDTKDGDKNVGPATEDTDGDGVPDTAVVKDADGNTWLYTDTNHTGHADQEVEITKTGEVHVLQHTGEHQWTEVEHGKIDSTGHYTPDTKSGLREDSDSVWGAVDFDGKGSAADGVVRIDSTTGQWISSN